ncbi:hypothetical protein K469DRAFT_478981, partial [Zopfia rhizophila CBS 207.26]
HQRIGAGALIMAHIVQHADALGLPTYLEATAQGLMLYKKYGFQRVGTLNVGEGDHAFSITFMTRLARP